MDSDAPSVDLCCTGELLRPDPDGCHREQLGHYPVHLRTVSVHSTPHYCATHRCVLHLGPPGEAQQRRGGRTELHGGGGKRDHVERGHWRLVAPRRTILNE